MCVLQVLFNLVWKVSVMNTVAVFVCETLQNSPVIQTTQTFPVILCKFICNIFPVLLGDLPRKSHVICHRKQEFVCIVYLEWIQCDIVHIVWYNATYVREY